MTDALKVLIVEDNPSDARLMEHALRHIGTTIECRRVDQETDYLALLEQAPDIILSDYSMPNFDAMRALELLRERQLDIPFIIVSGSIGEDVAVGAMQQGAADFIIKDRMARLGPAVEKALHARALRVKQRHTEEQLHQSQKMEAVGRLAGGIAHDFNNLLTVVSGYSELALDQLRVDDPLRETIEEIRKASLRAVSLTRQLLAFSRRQMLVPIVLSLNAVVQDMENMLGRLIGESIDLAIQPADDLWFVKVDAGQIEQVLMNLTINSRDAMPDGGKLTIVTANVELDEAYAAANPGVTAGEYVLLTVSDTGCGMDRATLARIFEPFFTTKGPEHGTGLGLATIYGIVKQSGGHIDVTSEPGRGTTFRISLPRERERLPTFASSSAPRTDLSGTETILVVEDEDGVRSLARTILVRSGYTVLEAANGEAALQVSAEYPQEIHLLATDLIMPNMNGRELAERLRPLRPEMKVLFLSGYMDDEIVRHGLNAGLPFLQKPYSVETLTQKVRELLNPESS